MGPPLKKLCQQDIEETEKLISEITHGGFKAGWPASNKRRLP
jgi:hypothetical protein